VATGVGGAVVFGSTARAEGKDAPVLEYSMLQKCFAEALGTGMIVAGGCGVVCALKYAGHSVNALGIGLAFGASVTLAIYATRNVSGAHLNPAVTLAVAVNDPEACPLSTAVPYMISQVLGGAAAAALNYAAFSGGIAAMEASSKIVRGMPGSCASFAGAFGMVPTSAIVKTPAAFVVEAAMTAALVFCIFCFTDPEKGVPADAAPALIGLTVGSLVHVFAPVTGCGMNPARDLGPRLVTMATGWGGAALSSGWWVYTAGPLLGGVLGGAAYIALYKPSPVAAKEQ